MTNGMNRETGKPLSRTAHLAQSVTDILTTPIGSRVIMREYGSRLPRLVDRPMNATTIMEVYAATAEALERWEPRIQLNKVSADFSGFVEGRLAITLQGIDKENNQPLVLNDLLVDLRR
jgi:phage baseplate assembly protein W